MRKREDRRIASWKSFADYAEKVIRHDFGEADPEFDRDAALWYMNDIVLKYLQSPSSNCLSSEDHARLTQLTELCIEGLTKLKNRLGPAGEGDAFAVKLALILGQLVTQVEMEIYHGGAIIDRCRLTDGIDMKRGSPADRVTKALQAAETVERLQHAKPNVKKRGDGGIYDQAAKIHGFKNGEVLRKYIVTYHPAK